MLAQKRFVQHKILAIKNNKMANNNFTSFPVLVTERLTIRQLSTADQQDIFAMRSDTEINKYLNREPSKTPEDAITFINKVNDNIRNNNSIYWVISLTNSKTFVGTICLFDFSNEKDSCEIGYELMTKFQGQGIMKEAAQAVLNYAIHTLKFKKVIAFTHPDNHNSTKLLTKLNFVKAKEANKDNPNLSIFTFTL